MQISQIINKVIEDQPLAEEEKELLRTVDPDKLESDRLELQAERESFEKEQTDVRRRELIHNLAAQYSFSDPAYLAFLANDKNIDLTDADAVENFMTELQNHSPKLFELELNPGSASGISVQPQQNCGRLSGNSCSLAQLLADAPDCSD